MSVPIAECGQITTFEQLLRLASYQDQDSNVGLSVTIEAVPVTSGVSCDYDSLASYIQRMFYNVDGKTTLRLFT